MDTKEPSNLGDALPWQIERVGKIRDEYLQLPNNAGAFAAHLMQIDINIAIQASTRGDVVFMLQCYEKLKEYEL